MEEHVLSELGTPGAAGEAPMLRAEGRPLRVLMVTPLLGGVDYFGGIPASVAAYETLIRRVGAEVVVAAGIRIEGSLRDAGRWSRMAARASSRLGTCNGRELLRCVRGVRWADVVLVHAWFHVLARLASWLAVRAGKPWVLVPHGTLMEPARQHRGWKKRIELLSGGQRLIQTARLAFLASEREAGWSRPYLPAQTVLVPPPVPVAAAHPRRSESGNGRLRIGFLGRLHRAKRVDLMLEACRDALGTDGEFELVLVGPDESHLVPRLAQQYRELFASGLARWEQPLDGSAKHAFLAASDALLLASAFESYGVVILEAWAQGTPCLVTPAVGLADVVETHQGGIVLSALSPPAILEGIRRLKAALRSGQIHRAGLRDLALEYGERRPVVGFSRGMELCGIPAHSGPGAAERQRLTQDESPP